ncbi:MAG: hypothetical protein ABSG03_12840 [Bryobacteraceae bacterium]
MPAIRVSCAGKLFLFLLAAGVASGQIYPPGGYPPGGYPPGGYPGGGYPGGGYPGAGIPIPSRGGKAQPNSSTKGQPLPNFRGKLKKMDAKTISLALDDDRVLDFRRDSKTKFYKGGDEVKDPKFNPGDQLSIEGPEDNTGAMVAVNVYWEKAAGAATTADAKSKDDKVPDAWADAPSQTHGTEAAPPPAKHDSDDPGPPTLQRGAVADPSREKSAPVPAQPVAQDAPATGSPADRPTLSAANGQTPERLPQYIPRDDGSSNNNNGGIGNDAIEGSLRHQDDLIRRAADTALDFTETLPNYVCQELMSRYQSESRPANWQALDVVGTEVIYENGKEDYRKVTVNGRPVNKKLEEVGGSWSTGEFGTVLISLFSPGTATEFHYRRDSRIAGILTKEYDFTVTHAHSNWRISMGSQSYDPGYSGTAWIDPATARVMRIEMSARSFPSDFPSDDVESATDYEYIRLGDAKQYLLPVHSETLSCLRGTNDCNRNVIDFRNYRKYTGESTITFGDPKK